MKKAVTGALCLALAGCATAPVRWTKPGATVTDFDQAKAECQYEAVKSTASMPTGYGLGGAIASGIEEGTRQGEVAVLCMRAKGWAREQVAG